VVSYRSRKQLRNRSCIFGTVVGGVGVAVEKNGSSRTAVLRKDTMSAVIVVR